MSPGKHIVIVGREYSSSTGTYVKNLINQLQLIDQQNNYTIIVNKKDENKVKLFNNNFKLLSTDCQDFSIQEQTKLLFEIKKLKPDLVHFTMTQQPIFLNLPVVTTIHDLTTVRFDNPAKNFLIFKFKQLIYRAVIKIVSKKSKLIITPSNFVKQDLVNYSKIAEKKVRVTYESAEFGDKTTEPIKNLIGKDFILYVGRPNPHKNLQNLIKAFEIIKRSQPKLLLVLAGQLDQNYLAIKNSLSPDLKDQIIFTDYISDQGLNWLYKNALVYAFPSLSEGFGLPGLEAMSFGLPLISSNATCLPEIYQNAAIYFNPLDVIDIANKINYVINDSSVREDLIKNGYIRLKSFSWKKMAEKTLTIYLEALSN